MKIKGFTLVETMVAITIVTLAVAGPMFSASRAVVAAQGARYQLIASHLAQEGIEYVRLMRDNEYLAAVKAGDTSVAWNNFLNGTMPLCPGSIKQCRSPNICTLDPVISPLGMGYGSNYSLNAFTGNASLYLKTSSNIYTQQSAGNTKTIFTRTIQTFSPSATDERIDSKVSWSFHGTNYSVTVSDHLTPWR